MTYVIPREDLKLSETVHRFQGGAYSGVPISCFIVTTLPGKGGGLHSHPYEEVFIVQKGHVTFTIGDATVEARNAEIVIAPANTPHKYTNTGDEPLEMIGVHPSKEVIQWEAE